MFWRVILFCWLATQVAIANPTRSGTLTWSGSPLAPAVAVTVNGATAQTNGDFTFASSGQTLSNGANTFTVIATSPPGPQTTTTFTRNLPVSVNHYTDTAGNVTALLDANENVAARYLYDPFGRLLGQWGALGNANWMQFSSMPHHGNSGLSLYPFRAYDPVLQRWLSRDPIGEAGGIDLYAFTGNSPLNAVDSDGRVLHILAGAAAGALIGGGFSIASDLFHGRDVDWVQAGISATEGAIAGAVASATFGTSLAGSGLALAARGAAAGLAGDLAAQGAGLAAQSRQCFSFKEAGLSTLLGAGGPLAGKLLGKFIEKAAERTAMRNVVEFQGMEVRAVRDLSHLDQETHEAMQQLGFTGTTKSGKKIILHHMDLNPARPLVEMPEGNNNVWNTVQHPFGNTAGAGLNDAERAAFNSWRKVYWQWRATQEMNLRRVN